MPFRFEFSRYLRSKVTVDDRALHPRVFSGFKELWPAARGARVLELGAGVGTMVDRLRSSGLGGLEYHLLDSSEANLQQARATLKSGAGWSFATTHSEIESFLDESSERFDALLAHAVLDLCDLETVVPRFHRLLGPHAPLWLSLNFDTWTQWEPRIDADLDARIIHAYHATMNRGGSGSRLFRLLADNGLRLLDAGPSDWAVYAGSDGRYPADETYFLLCILHFFETSLSGSAIVSRDELSDWLELRRAQVLAGKAVFLAHQWDFLAET